MNRAGCLALVALLAVTGCGRRHEEPASELKFELPTDTTGLSRGSALLTRIEPYRLPGGGLRIRGEVGFPDGVRLQISIVRKGTHDMLARVQVVTADHRFETTPILPERGALPRGAYRLEVLALFNPAWQTAEVLRVTNDGRDLRGPGMSRDPVGGASFFLVEERKL
jgi:hypothetical protein